LRKAAPWRGSPTATSKKEFMDLLSKAKLSKNKDVFFDLGCGFGRVCIWMAPKVRLAVGFENHYDRFKVARGAAEKSGYKNISIRYADFSFASFKKATIIYSIVDIGLHVVARINRQAKSGTRLILYRRPSYPIKGKRISGNYFLMKTPIKRVKDESEFARTILGRDATIDELYRAVGKEDAKDLKREVRQSEKLWKELFT
jgi:SAM-dependent methyltransferase